MDPVDEAVARFKNENIDHVQETELSAIATRYFALERRYINTIHAIHVRARLARPVGLAIVSGSDPVRCLTPIPCERRQTATEKSLQGLGPSSSSLHLPSRRQLCRSRLLHSARPARRRLSRLGISKLGDSDRYQPPTGRGLSGRGVNSKSVGIVANDIKRATERFQSCLADHPDDNDDCNTDRSDTSNRHRGHGDNFKGMDQIPRVPVAGDTITDLDPLTPVARPNGLVEGTTNSPRPATPKIDARQSQVKVGMTCGIRLRSHCRLTSCSGGVLLPYFLMPAPPPLSQKLIRMMAATAKAMAISRTPPPSETLSLLQSEHDAKLSLTRGGLVPTSSPPDFIQTLAQLGTTTNIETARDFAQTLDDWAKMLRTSITAAEGQILAQRQEASGTACLIAQVVSRVR